MGASNGDQRPPLAVALELAYLVTSVAMMMALPAGAGYWGDLKLGTSPCLVILGAVAGLGIGMLQLLRFAGEVKKRPKNRPDQNER
jgi:F0F1-type ATP synthase assembly protein I